jgi:predicted cupin superfamily sugar epimerase
MTGESRTGTWRSIADRLGMQAHPEGGWYVETWRSGAVDGAGRSIASAILFLLPAGERSHWHRVDADELWQWSGGEALELRIGEAGSGETGSGPTVAHRLGGDVLAGEVPQVVVPAGAWQSAVPLGAWTLVACIVAPAFTFDGFELAPTGWEPAESPNRG